MSEEEWRAIPGYEGCYEVSNLGRVRSLDRVVPRGNRRLTIHGRIMSPALVKEKYLAVRLSMNGRGRTHEVHRLVALAFVSGFEPGLEACHNDNDSLNNVPENLRWDTHHENMLDIVRAGYHPSQRKTHCKRGHEFTPENIYWTSTGSRACRKCSKIWHREKYLEKIGKPE